MISHLLHCGFRNDGALGGVLDRLHYSELLRLLLLMRSRQRASDLCHGRSVSRVIYEEIGHDGPLHISRGSRVPQNSSWLL